MRHANPDDAVESVNGSTQFDPGRLSSHAIAPTRQRLRLAVLIAAVAGALAGAVLSLLPALLLAMVTLFYNGAGGILVFLGSLIPTLPHPSGAGQGASALPVFQQLNSNPTAVILRSVVATALCAAAAALMLQDFRRQLDSRLWRVVGLCCILASFAGGRLVAVCMIPAVVTGIGRLVQRRMRDDVTPG